MENIGQAPISVGRRVATSAIVAISNQVVVKCAAQFWMKRRLPNGSENTAQLENKSCFGSVVVEHFRVQLFAPIQSFCGDDFYSSDEVAWSLAAPQVSMLYMFSIRCCYFSVILSHYFCAE